MKNNDATKYIAYLGSPTFPIGLAEVQKMILISKSLLLAGNHVTVICRNGTHNKDKNSEIKAHGTFDNIEYIYASGGCFRNDSFFKRRVFEIKGRVNEVLLLRKLSKRKKLDYAILSTWRFRSILLYWFLAKLFRFKIILNYVEYYSGVKKKWSRFGRRLNDMLFDKYAVPLSDAVFPISEFLIARIKKKSPGKKFLKIPVLTDFEKYNMADVLQDQKYFLFCGDAGYKEIITFIIDSFNLVNDNTAFCLYLVIGGNENNISEVKEYITNQPTKDRIKLFSRISEKQLYTYYKNATALLIPLRPTFQDAARFPHKIGEYLASANPVISTNYGEIKYYFKNKENMLLANSYDINLFAEKMQFVIENPTAAKEIGITGSRFAFEKFGYRAWAKVLKEFLNSEF